MKLNAIIKGDTGKEVNKTSNNNIAITFTKDRRQKFDINFDGDRLEVLRYSDAKIITVEYMDPDGNIKCHQCNRHFYGLEGKEDTCPSCLQKLM
ncbi:MAG: hypothetical protein EBR82_14485 [Caulobacteraceae bacterium]|nr:hypothetical protein [Caulobacteraceae bacterium]